MNASPELRQQMWELCYDLLPPDERATLVTRIKSDPQAARLYAEVRLQADLVGYAAKVEDSSFVLSVGEKVAPVPTAASARGAAFAGRRAHGGSTWANWFSAAAALVLVGLIGYGYVRPLTIAQQVALGTIVEVEVPAELNEGLSYPIAVRTWGLQHDGREAHPEAAEVAVRLTGRDGDERFYKVIPTDESGEGQVELPGDALAPGVRLEVEALSRELTDSELTAGERAAAKRPAGPPVAVDLPVRPESELSYYFYERPAAPGEEIAGNRVDVKRFSLATTVNPTHQSALDGDRSGSGKAQESARAGYVDAQHPARALQRDKAPAELRKSLAADGAVGKPGDDRKEEERAKPRPSAKLADGSEGDTDSFQSNRRLKADIAKGDIAPTAEPAAAPASPPALPAAPFAGAAPASPVPPPAGPAPTGDGRAANSLAEQKRAERLQALAENLEKQTVAAGQGLVVEVPAELRDRKELIATATNRGITVASQAVGAAPQVKLALPPEVDGEIRIALVDPAQSPPEVLQESLAYRQPRRELKIALQDLKSHYAPGEQVRLKVAIRDENDRPAQAAVGVRVWNEALVKATGDEPVLLADAVRHAGQSEYEIAEQPASVALGGGAANFRGMTKDSDALAMLPAQAAAKQQADKKAPPTGNAQPTANAPAAEAPPAGQAALGLEQQDKLERFHKEVTEFAAQPALEGDRAQLAELPGENGSPVIGNSLTSGPLVVSNRATVELESQVRTEQLRDQWHDWQQLLGRVLLAGGVLLLAVLGALGLMRYPLRTSSGMMGAVAAAAGIVVGLAWINVGPVAERQMAAVAVDGTSVAPAAPSNSTGEAFTTESYPAGDAADFVAPVVVPPARPLADDSFADRDEHREKANLAQAGPAGRAKSGRDDDHAADRPAKGGELFGGKLAGSLPAGGGVGGASGGGGRGGSPAEPQSKPAAAASDKPTSREKLEELSASSPTPGLTATTPAANPATSAPATSAPATSAPAISAPAPGAGPVVVDALKDDQSRQAAGEAAKRSRESDPSGAPAALYFNPQLMADEQGHAVIEFEMPAVPSTYRLLIDVYGNGRLGGMQTLLECKPPRPADQK